MTNNADDAQSRIEESHPIVKNAAVKGVGCGIAILGVVALVAFIIWSMSPLAPIGIAYSAVVGAIPWLLGVGALLLVLRLFTRKR
jgi:hypothetical protein